MQSCQQFDVGFELGLVVLDQFGVEEDLSDFSSASVLLESPTGKRKTRGAVLEPGESRVVYVTGALDLDEWGDWRVQALLVGNTAQVRTRVQILRVLPNVDGAQIVLRPDAIESQGLILSAIVDT